MFATIIYGTHCCVTKINEYLMQKQGLSVQYLNYLVTFGQFY